MIKTAEINQRLLEDLPVIRLPKFVPPGGGLSIWWMGDDRITFQATSADTNGAYAFWVDEPPGHVGPPKHVHSREEEGFYIIEGQVAFRAGHIDEVLTKDTFIALPKGIPHSWTNTTIGHARLITFTAGAGNEGFFLTLGAPGVGPAGPRATLPLEQINARTRRYGVTYMETTDNPLDGALEIGAGRSPTVVRPTEGERLHAGGAVYLVKACGSVTAQAYTLIEVHIEPGGIMPAHRHATFEEGIYVLEGSVRATLDGENYEAAAGSLGNSGLIAVDKIGNQILFLDPRTYATTLTLDAFAPRVHELAISPDHRTAYVPIYGDGIHGRNPHPGHLIAFFDLVARRHAGDFSTYPHLAPHGLRWGPQGQLYCVCENSGVVLEMDTGTGGIESVIEVGSDKAHRIEVTPDGSKLYTENEEDTLSCVIDLKARKRIKKIPAPNGLAGIGMSPDGRTIVLVDAKQPQILIVDTASDEIVRTVRLEGHEKAAQIARYSPDGKYPVLTSYDAPLGTIFDARLQTQKLLQLGKGPMNMAFHPDGRTLLIANHDAGSLAVVDLERAEVLRTVPAGVGVETLSFY